MATDTGINRILLIGIPLEYQSGMTTGLVRENYTLEFSNSKEEAVKIIRSGELSAVIITSDLVFDDDVNQDIIALTYGKIPTLTIVLEETFKKLSQGKVWEKIYNPDALQEFCTTPFSMEELAPRLRKVIGKADKASRQ